MAHLTRGMVTVVFSRPSFIPNNRILRRDRAFLINLICKLIPLNTVALLLQQRGGKKICFSDFNSVENDAQASKSFSQFSSINFETTAESLRAINLEIVEETSK